MIKEFIDNDRTFHYYSGIVKHQRTNSYYISCPGTTARFSDDDCQEDSPPVLENPDCREPTLLRSVYKQKKFLVDETASGIHKMSGWLPIQRQIDSHAIPVSFISKKLARHLGLKDLLISFSGYWPERNCYMTSCSFKECEAEVVCSRFPPVFFSRSSHRGSRGSSLENRQFLTLASAGNTARSFVSICSKIGMPVIVVLPQQNLSAIRMLGDVSPCVSVIAIEDGDYYDAIQVAEHLSQSASCIQEGGTKNIARRDGMALTTLSAVYERGRIPDHYFQAVASGGGAIAAWETNERLRADGRWGKNKMQLHLSQNSPFLLITRSWQRGSRELLPLSDDEGRRQSSAIYAKTLSNRFPAYSIRGGLYDALSDSAGQCYAVENEEARNAARLFEELEGIDIAPAAAVACASLIQACEEQRISRNDCILLNITGGGNARLAADHELHDVPADLTMTRSELLSLSADELLHTLMQKKEVV